MKLILKTQHFQNYSFVMKWLYRFYKNRYFECNILIYKIDSLNEAYFSLNVI